MKTIITLENKKTFSIEHDAELGIKIGDVVEFELPANNTDKDLEKIMNFDGQKIINLWEEIGGMKEIKH
jgi:hypothetical protein